MTDFVNDAISVSDIHSGIHPGDLDTIERQFLHKFSERCEAIGEGYNNRPRTRFNSIPGKLCLHGDDKYEIKFIEPPRPRYLLPAGDSELDPSSSAAASAYTEDEIKIGESATDWQEIKFRQQLSPSSSYLHAGENLDIDKIFHQADSPSTTDDTCFEMMERRSLMLGNWADQVPIVPFKTTWTFDDMIVTLSDILFGGIGIVLFYRILKRRFR